MHWRPTISGDIAFTIKAGQANSHSGPRYRQTKNTNNKWKVKLEKSGEGKGTVTRFWLEKSSGKNVSTTVNVKQGHKPYYTPAYTDASKTYVRLTAENNADTSKTYRVSGYWDEETK